MEMKILNYIRSLPIDNSLKTFLESLFISGINQKLLCLCILIEMKYGLLDEINYISVIKNIAPSLELNYENFTNSMNVVFGNKNLNRMKYSRVVSLTTYKDFIGSFKNNRLLEIDRRKDRR